MAVKARRAGGDREGRRSVALVDGEPVVQYPVFRYQAGELRGIEPYCGDLTQRSLTGQEIHVLRRDGDRLGFARGVEHQARAGVELDDTAQRAADGNRDIDVGRDPVCVDHERAERAHGEELVARGGSIHVGPEIEARGHERLQAGRVSFEQEHAVQAEYVFQFDLAAELNADQEPVEIEHDRRCGVAGVDFEPGVESAVTVDVQRVYGGLVAGFEAV